MKILLLGANGRTGREILVRALNADDSVTAFVRAADKLANVSHPNLTVHAGNACNASDIKSALPGQDIVISTLGPRTPTRAACEVYSESAIAIVKAMQESDVNRLLVISTALLFPSHKLSDRFFRLIARHNAHYAKQMEETIGNSNLDWTIARVGFLNNKTSTEYRLAEGSLPDGGSSISRTAVASFLLTAAKQSEHIGAVIGLGE